MTLLPWRSQWCWRMRTGRRTRWQAWNHDRNEVLRVALYPNPVWNEMWFLTVDPFVGITVFIAKLSKRQYCWRVFEDFHSQEYIQFFDIHRCLFMRLHFSIGCHDYRKTTRFRQGIHFSRIQVLFPDHVHRRSRVENKLSFLKLKICWCRQAPIFTRSEECCFGFLLVEMKNFWPASTLLRGHLALATLSLPETDPQILERLSYAHEVHLGKSVRVKGFALERLLWILHVGSVSACLSSSVKSMMTSAAPNPENTFQRSHCTPFFWKKKKKPFVKLFINLTMCVWALFPKPTTTLGLVEQAFWRVPFFTKWVIASSSEVILRGHRDILPLGLLPLGLRGSRRFSFILLHERIWRRIWWCLFARLLTSWRKLQLSPSEHCPLAFHCQQISKNALSTLFCPLILDQGVLLIISISVTKIVISNVLLDTSFHHSFQSVIILTSSDESPSHTIPIRSWVSQTLVFLICTILPSIDNKIPSHFESDSWIWSFRSGIGTRSA